jgi:hypothetical protein
MKKEQADDTKIAVISTDIGYIKTDLSEIKQSLKELSGVFASKQELLEVAKQFEIRLGVLEKSNGLLKWVAPILGAVGGSALTYLLISYLQNI